MRSHALPTAVCALLAATVTAEPDNTLHARSQCYSGVFTLVSRGSEEVQGQSVLETIASGVTSAIPNSGSNEVVYPALLSFWNSAPTGVTNAQQQMQNYYSSCPDGKMVLMGYSQGSYVLATALAGGNYSGQTWAPLADDIGKNIAAVVLFGDPSRDIGQGTMAEGTNCETACTATSPLALTNGYWTAMQTYADRLQQWCDDEDPICCSTGNNITAHLSYWSTNTTDTVVQYVQSMIGNASTTSSTSSSSSASSTASTTSSSSTASSAVSAAVSSTKSIVASQSAELAAATHSSTGSSTATSLQGPAAATVSASASATASKSGGSRTTFSTLMGIGSLSLCSALLYMHLPV